MPQVILETHDGQENIAEGITGDNLMSVATSNNVAGIDGDCGGSCACGTCHIFVSDDWIHSLPPPSTMEQAMLAMRPDRQENSRLACQIELTDTMDGFAATMPEYQM